MAIALEQIVRPFGQAAFRPPNWTNREPPQDETVVEVEFGNGGPTIFEVSETFTGEGGGFQVTESREVSRTFDVVRVKNEADPTQSVDVEVMTGFQQRNKYGANDDKGKTTGLSFASPEASDNIEIIKRNQRRSSGIV